jgi:hypothetical protein
MASVKVPGVLELGSSGTVRWPQAKLLLSRQGLNAIWAGAEAAADAQALAANSITAIFLTDGRTRPT